MRKVKGLIGQELISRADGHHVAPVKDVVISEDHSTVTALVVEEAGVLSTARVVPMEAIHSFGRDAIVIEGDAAVLEASAAPALDVATDRSLAGMKVFSDSGQEVGTVADVYFQEDGGRIVGFEVSSGTLGDLASGPRFLPVEDVDHIGEDIVYVRPEAPDALQVVPEGTTGAMGAMEDVRERLSDVAHDASERLSDVAHDASERLSGAATKVGTAVDEATREDPADKAPEPPPGTELIGRRSGSDVTDDQGRILVAHGQLITVQHVDRAREKGQLEALRASADAWDKAERERAISGAVEQIADTAGSAWDRFMGALSQMTDDTGKRVNEQQAKSRLAAINDAVGRPVTKVILDRSDEVVLNLGDIITHEAVQRAHDAGILDSLLASVYKGEVAFDRDEMRAPTDATSTVDRATGGAQLVEDLEGTLTSSEEQRQQAADRKRREAEEARDRRESERQERAAAREEAARRGANGEPEPAEPARDDAAQRARSRTAQAGSKGGR
jgi:uncharacterized protein YrrD